MEPVASIDFETFSEADLSEVGTAAYAAHPSTVPLCLAYHLPGMQAPRCVDLRPWVESQSMPPIPLELEKWIMDGRPIEAHNCEFEHEIWNRKMVRDFSWMPIKLEQWRCTMARAAAMALPLGLDGAASALGLAQRKDAEGKKLMMKMCKPQKPTKADPRTIHRSDDEMQRLMAYCGQDVRAELALAAAVPELSPDELEAFHLHLRINTAGIPVDHGSAKVVARLVEVMGWHWQEKVREAGCDPGNLGSWQEMIPWFASQGMQLPNYQIATLEDALTWPHCTKAAQTVICARLAMGKASVKKLPRIMAHLGGRVRGGTVFHGATTGRWTGKGLQPHNMQRDSLSGIAWDSGLALAKWADTYAYNPAHVAAGIDAVFGDGMEMAGQMLRGMIAAPAGQTFLQADFSAVEARGVAWVSGCDLLLTWFREGKKIYEEMAGRIVGKDASEIAPDSIERMLGKQVVLGGGYGMSGEKRQDGSPSTFQLTCEKYGIACTPEMASSAIKAYRETFPEIPAFWKAAENAAKEAVRNGGSTAVRIASRGPAIWFKLVDGHLFCKLPSGRKICYPFARLSAKPAPWDREQMLEVVTFMEENINRQWVRGDTYGGKLTENIVQAICRDLERDSMLRCATVPGWEVVHHCHDEIMVLTKAKPEKEIDAELKEYIKCVSTVPTWAAGFPLRSGGWCGPRYKK